MEFEVEFLDKAKIIASKLNDLGAKKIEVLNVSRKSPDIKFIIICSSPDEQFNKVLAKDIQPFLNEVGLEVFRVDGEFKGEWIIVDCYEILVQILTDKARSRYNLEKLWKDGKNLVKIN